MVVLYCLDCYKTASVLVVYGLTAEEIAVVEGR
jgi:hypothetical protein